MTEEADALHSDVPTPPRRFRAARLSIFIVLAGALIFTLLEWRHLTYHWTPQPGTPHPEIALVTLEPRFGIGEEIDALAVGRGILWERPAAENSRLVLFTALGRRGEPAVRLAAAPEGTAPEFTTIGYAVRRIDGWEWLSESQIHALEEAAEARRTGPVAPASIGGVTDPNQEE